MGVDDLGGNCADDLVVLVGRGVDDLGGRLGGATLSVHCAKRTWYDALDGAPGGRLGRRGGGNSVLRLCLLSLWKSSFLVTSRVTSFIICSKLTSSTELPRPLSDVLVSPDVSDVTSSP